MSARPIAALGLTDDSPERERGPVMVTGIADVRPRPRRVAIGNFDGVHRGHADVIRGCDTVLTFDPHPLAVLAPDRAPALLTSLREKVARLGELGVREVVVMPFDRGVAALGPEAFMEDVLVERLGAVHVSVGSDFRFGARAAGDLSTLRSCPRFTTCGKALVRDGGELVSSTRIRAAIAAGDVDVAAKLLGRPHRVGCRSIGSGRVALDGAILAPPPGLYRCRLVPDASNWVLEFLAPHR